MFAAMSRYLPRACADAAPQRPDYRPRPPRAPGYLIAPPLDFDRTGKFYMGREISDVMGWRAADWLERPERLEEERTDLLVEAHDRQGLLRDISELLSRERINVTAVSTLSKADMARMSFTVEIASVGQIQKILTLLRDVDGVVEARRG